MVADQGCFQALGDENDVVTLEESYEANYAVGRDRFGEARPHFLANFCAVAHIHHGQEVPDLSLAVDDLIVGNVEAVCVGSIDLEDTKFRLGVVRADDVEFLKVDNRRKLNLAWTSTRSPKVTFSQIKPFFCQGRQRQGNKAKEQIFLPFSSHK